MRLKDYFSTKDFYFDTARIAVPLALQSALMSCQSMIDTLMVSWIGKVTAVGIAAQVDVLSSMVSYGIIGGVCMFASQFFGAEDDRNLKRCTGLALSLTVFNALLWILAATFFGRQILTFYMNDASVVEDGLLYLRISKYSLLVHGVAHCLSHMYRSTAQPKVALRTAILTTVCNIVLNYILIFGFGPIKAMGIEGAALATLIAHGVSAVVLITYSYYSNQRFAGTFSEMFSLDMGFIKPIFVRIMPLIVNETTFGVGQTLFVKAFGQLGKDQMDAYYVGNQIFNLMTFVIYGYGNAVQILLGQKLGRGEIEEAKKECRWHIGMAFVLSCVLVLFLIIFAKPLVMLFALNDPVKESLAVVIVDVFAVKASMRLYNFMIFSILRSGGDSQIIQFLDSGLEWAVGLPCAFICVNFLHMENIALVLLITQLEQLVRLFFGMLRVHSGKWANDLTVLVQS